MAEAGFDHESIARNLDDCWVWRNVFVADTDVEAERIGIPAFQAMVEARAELRNRIYRETGMRIDVPAGDCPLPAPASTTALSTGRRGASPKRSPKSTNSGSAG